jgi:PQQ-dependent catabolism-associated beta-propeller protein
MSKINSETPIEAGPVLRIRVLQRQAERLGTAIQSNVRTGVAARRGREMTGTAAFACRVTRAFAASAVLGAAVLLGLPLAASAKDTGLIFVANEKSSTITVLDRDDRVIKTFDTCARPRGMHFSADRDEFFVGCADDSVIAVYNVATQELKRRIRDVAEPETFDLHPNGRHLYVSNEEDATATVFDVETGEFVAEFETGEEPEGVLVTSDGRLVFVASEAANLVHVIDTQAAKVVKDLLVDTRPRRFALTPDERELWVSAELAGIVDIIDVGRLEIIDDITFLPTGFRKEQVTPVDLLITRDGTRAYVALGRANHVAVVDVPARKVIAYILVGKRAWGLALTRDESKLYVANGLSDDVSIIDTQTLKVTKSIPVGMVPYGILIDDR